MSEATPAFTVLMDANVQAKPVTMTDRERFLTPL
jgi:hypothetical protein